MYDDEATGESPVQCAHRGVAPWLVQFGRIDIGQLDAIVKATDVKYQAVTVDDADDATRQMPIVSRQGAGREPKRGYGQDGLL